MTQTAIVQGLARWADRNMTDKFTAGGPTRIVFCAITKLADANPVLAKKMFAAKYPSLAPLLDVVNDAESFNSVWDALKCSVKESGCLTLDVREEFPFSGRVQTFRFRDCDLDSVRDEIEKAYREELASAQAVVSAGINAQNGDCAT